LVARFWGNWPLPTTPVRFAALRLAKPLPSPTKLPLTVPAAKLPLPSRLTTVPGVLALVALFTGGFLVFSVLTLSVNIPEEVSLQPRFVYWQRGEPGEKKFLEIVVADPKKFSVESASCADPAFAVTMEPVVTPGHYKLAIKPTDATRPAQAVVRIELRTEGRLEIRTAYVAVK